MLAQETSPKQRECMTKAQTCNACSVSQPAKCWMLWAVNKTGVVAGPALGGPFQFALFCLRHGATKDFKQNSDIWDQICI
jgi:hypothetical protein